MAKRSERNRAKKNRKKKSLFDLAMDLIIIGAFIILAAVVGSIVWSNIRESQEAKADEPAQTEAAEATPSATPEGITTYICQISNSEELGYTEFEMVFNSNDMTYTEMLRAGTQESELDKGTYEESDGQIITKSTETEDSETVYLLDGDYLLASEQLYRGQVPDDAGETFSGKFTYNINDMGKTTIRFNEDGTYLYKTVTYAEEGASEEDSVVTEKGTYKREGNWISRTANSGEEKLAYYIYQGRITNAYYIKQS